MTTLTVGYVPPQSVVTAVAEKLRGFLIEERSHLLEHVLGNETVASVTKIDIITKNAAILYRQENLGKVCWMWAS